MDPDLESLQGSLQFLSPARDELRALQNLQHRTCRHQGGRFGHHLTIRKHLPSHDQPLSLGTAFRQPALNQEYIYTHIFRRHFSF
jgi:hypothetical protein